MKKCIAVVMIVLSAAVHSASAQEATRRGEFEPPATLPDTLTPPAAKPGDAAPTPGTPVGVPAADNPDKTTLPKPAMEPLPLSKTPATTAPGTAIMAGPVTAQGPGCQSPGCGCQPTCQHSCCAKLAAWLCHHREKTPDCCYRIDHPDAQLYTYFLDYPCRSASITAVGPTTSCQCKKPCPWEGCVFGQCPANGNLSCH
jgi:hypothetical protein